MTKTKYPFRNYFSFWLLNVMTYLYTYTFIRHLLKMLYIRKPLALILNYLLICLNRHAKCSRISGVVEEKRKKNKYTHTTKSIAHDHYIAIGNRKKSEKQNERRKRKRESVVKITTKSKHLVRLNSNLVIDVVLSSVLHYTAFTFNRSFCVHYYDALMALFVRFK